MLQNKRGLPDAGGLLIASSAPPYERLLRSKIGAIRGSKYGAETAATQIDVNQKLNGGYTVWIFSIDVDCVKAVLLQMLLTGEDKSGTACKSCCRSAIPIKDAVRRMVTEGPNQPIQDKILRCRPDSRDGANRLAAIAEGGISLAELRMNTALACSVSMSRASFQLFAASSIQSRSIGPPMFNASEPFLERLLELYLTGSVPLRLMYALQSLPSGPRVPAYFYHLPGVECRARQDVGCVKAYGSLLWDIPTVASEDYCPLMQLLHLTNLDDNTPSQALLCH